MFLVFQEILDPSSFQLPYAPTHLLVFLPTSPLSSLFASFSPIFDHLSSLYATPFLHITDFKNFFYLSSPSSFNRPLLIFQTMPASLHHICQLLSVIAYYHHTELSMRSLRLYQIISGVNNLKSAFGRNPEDNRDT